MKAIGLGVLGVAVLVCQPYLVTVAAGAAPVEMKDIVAAMPPERQLAFVLDKLKELNPAFDGKCSHRIEAGALTELGISTVGVNDLTPVGMLPWLKKLTLTPGEANRKGLLSDLSPLKGLSLKGLYCPNNPVKDVAPLAGMPLTELNIAGTLVSDLSPLAGMKLTVLGCNDTPVGDLKPLAGMPLKVLWCQNARVNDLSPLNGAPLQELRCDAAVGAQNIGVLREIKTLAKINDLTAAAFLMTTAPTKATAMQRPAVSVAPTVGVPSKLPKEMVVELGDGVKMEFVLVPAGSFRMGSDKYHPNETPVHNVTIAKPFYMGKYEVTQEQWEKVMGKHLSRTQGAKLPVQAVTWDDCQKFIATLKDKVRGTVFRLPSEAEWEYACRAGSKTEYCYGDDIGKLGEYGWFEDNNEKQYHSVGQKKPNAWGLYDMHGNVGEWCEDTYHDTYKGAPADGRAWTRGGELKRVWRGSSGNAAYLRSARRRANNPDFVFSNCGLRLVMEVGK